MRKFWYLGGKNALFRDCLSFGINISPDKFGNLPFVSEELSKSFDWHTPGTGDFLPFVILEIIDEPKPLKETKISISSVRELEVGFVKFVFSGSDTVQKYSLCNLEMKVGKGNLIPRTEMVATWTAEDLLRFGFFNQYPSSLIHLSNEQCLIAHRKKVKK